MANCSSLGYHANLLGASAASYIPGYKDLTQSVESGFPAGTFQLAHHKIGVVKIGRFSPERYPELCAAAIADLHINAAALFEYACLHQIESWGLDRMSHDLENQLRALKAAGAQILLVDIANNGGGIHWAEAVARMMTSIELKSESRGLVGGEHWADAFAKTGTELRSDMKKAPQEDLALLRDLADAVAGRRKEAETACNSTSLWHGERPACNWLGVGFFASGLPASGTVQRFRGKPWYDIVFKPAKFPIHEGVWSGLLLVLVNGGTGSAAEQFAAVLQDNHAAVIIGSPTAGAGCGHTDGGTPTILRNSGGVLELPDCARFRADGTNEVMGIQPDILVGLRPTDGPHRQGLRIAAKLSEAVIRAIR